LATVAGYAELAGWPRERALANAIKARYSYRFDVLVGRPIDSNAAR
jgi:hypothetical protein